MRYVILKCKLLGIKNDSRQIALENYQKSLAGPQEDFDGVIHYGEAGRRGLSIHYDSLEPKPHW